MFLASFISKSWSIAMDVSHLGNSSLWPPSSHFNTAKSTIPPPTLLLTLSLHIGSRFLPSNLDLRIQMRFPVISSLAPPISDKTSASTPPRTQQPISLQTALSDVRDKWSNPAFLAHPWHHLELRRDIEEREIKHALPWSHQVWWKGEWNGEN